MVAVTGPLLFTLLLLTGLRQRVERLYQERANAVEVYRFDLARALHLPIPRDPEVFRELAGVMMGSAWPAEIVPSDEHGTHTASLASREQLEAMHERITRDVVAALQPELERLDDRQSQLSELVRLPSLNEQQLSALAELVAQRAAEPFSAGMRRHIETLDHTLQQRVDQVRERLEALQQTFYQRVGQLIEDRIESAVLGPPLANFTGFMVIDLKADGRGRPSPEPGEMVVAPVGGSLELSFFVFGDENARGAAPTLESGEQFFVVEPVHIDGGSSAAFVEFDAVADSPTLRAEPNRQRMTVGGSAGAEAPFTFQMPDHAGRHEIWFQLYQAGRLIQAVSIHIQVQPETSRAER
jgi:hypothetical protein